MAMSLSHLESSPSKTMENNPGAAFQFAPQNDVESSAVAPMARSRIDNRSRIESTRLVTQSRELIQKLHKEVEEEREKRQKALGELHRVQKQLDGFTFEEQGHQDTIQKYKAQEERLRDELVQAQSNERVWKAKVDMQDADLRRYQKELATQKTRVEFLEKSLDEKKAAADGAHDLEAQMRQLTADNKVLQEKLRHAEESVSSATGRVAAIELENKELTSENSSVWKQIEAKFEAKMRQLEDDKNDLRNERDKWREGKQTSSEASMQNQLLSLEVEKLKAQLRARDSSFREKSSHITNDLTNTQALFKLECDHKISDLGRRLEKAIAKQLVLADLVRRSAKQNQDLDKDVRQRKQRCEELSQLAKKEAKQRRHYQNKFQLLQSSQSKLKSAHDAMRNKYETAVSDFHKVQSRLASLEQHQNQQDRQHQQFTHSAKRAVEDSERLSRCMAELESESATLRSEKEFQAQLAAERDTTHKQEMETLKQRHETATSELEKQKKQLQETNTKMSSKIRDSDDFDDALSHASESSFASQHSHTYRDHHKSNRHRSTSRGGSRHHKSNTNSSPRRHHRSTMSGEQQSLAADQKYLAAKAERDSLLNMLQLTLAQNSQDQATQGWHSHLLAKLEGLIKKVEAQIVAAARESGRNDALRVR